MNKSHLAPAAMCDNYRRIHGRYPPINMEGSGKFQKIYKSVVGGTCWLDKMGTEGACVFSWGQQECWDFPPFWWEMHPPCLPGITKLLLVKPFDNLILTSKVFNAGNIISSTFSNEYFYVLFFSCFAKLIICFISI